MSVDQFEVVSGPKGIGKLCLALPVPRLGNRASCLYPEVSRHLPAPQGGMILRNAVPKKVVLGKKHAISGQKGHFHRLVHAFGQDYLRESIVFGFDVGVI